MIRILIAEDHQLVRAGLCRLIDECEDIEVVAEAADGSQVLNKVLSLNPDVAVIDISMPGLDGFEVLSQLREAVPELPVIVLTMHEEEQYVVRAIREGARAYLTKRSAPERLVEAIQRVRDGGLYLTEFAAEALAVHTAGGGEGRSALDGLSARELQVLRRLAMGQTNREIAEAYNISTKTVDTYRLRLLKKLSLRNNADLSRFAIKHGLVQI
jgi:DNA-binding NarL/FixJ family response regulator